MKILYDHQVFTNQVYGGISRYFYELMSRFSDNKGITFELSLLYSNNHYIENASFSSHRTFLKRTHFRGKQKLLHILNKQKSIRMLKKHDFDIFHPTYYNSYFLKYINNRPYVLTIHDMIHELFPEFFPAADKTPKWKKLLAEKAVKIIAISENTKRDIIKVYGINERKIEVVYHGNSLEPNQYVETTVELPEKYLFYVGDRHLYKNFRTFVLAVAQLLNEDRYLNIVCAGGEKIALDEIRFFKDLDICNRVHRYPINNDAILAYLYKNAIAFVYPSLYEGFGIPILEAFSCGCPVVVSNSGSFPEVAGSAAIYFNPTDTISIKEAIRNVLYDENLRKELERKGFEQLKKFSWEKTAKLTKEIYNRIL